MITLELSIPGAESLKDKRRILKSMLTRLRNTFNVSAAEVDFNDEWQSAGIAVATVTNSRPHADEVISKVVAFIEQNYTDVEIVNEQIEIL